MFAESEHFCRERRVVTRIGSLKEEARCRVLSAGAEVSRAAPWWQMRSFTAARVKAAFHRRRSGEIVAADCASRRRPGGDAQ